MHHLLTRYDIPYVPDGTLWPLSVGRRVRRPLQLDLAELRALPPVSTRVTMQCAGNGGALLTSRQVGWPWLAEAGVARDAVEVVFTGADHGVERGVAQDHRRSLPVDLAVGNEPEVLMAYAMNGAPLLPRHGRPLRLIVPGRQGMAQVKWLREITVTHTPSTGFQQAVAYRLRQDPADEGRPVTRIEPRALLVPPGFPDNMSRSRVVRPWRASAERAGHPRRRTQPAIGAALEPRPLHQHPRPAGARAVPGARRHGLNRHRVSRRPYGSGWGSTAAVSPGRRGPPSPACAWPIRGCAG
ncbi:molybdopterin-dependent oxidoreductase [Streptomyces sp. NPDC002092]